MLDDLKVIHERDVQDTLGVAERQWEQLTQTFELVGNQEFSQIDNIVYAAMGGSALAALFMSTWPRVGVPFEVVRDYDLPEYVNERTLVIAASYSGNTEETLHALEQAEARGAQIAIITGGGKLAEIAQSKNYLMATVPKAEQPRYAVFYNFKALLDMLELAGLVHDVAPELASAAEFLKSEVAAWIATVPISRNPAKKLALEALGKSVVIYGGARMAPAAYKWKISFNENAKQVAWWGQYPEFNHNEFIGWSKQPHDKPYLVVDLRSNLEHERTQKRFAISERMLSGLRPAPEVVEVQGDTLLKQLVWAITFGDFVSLYTGIANGLNPAPVELVEKFKQALND